MAKPNKTTAASPLQLDKATCMMRKISNNLQKWGSEYVTAFTCPLEDIGLNREKVDSMFGPGTWDSWFNVRAADQFAEPKDWWQHIPGGELKIDDEFDVDDVELGLSGSRKVKFEAEDIEDKDGQGGGSKSKKRKRPGGRLTDIWVKPTPGGIVQMACHLAVLPGLDDKNLLLQEHQMHPIKLTTGNAVLSEGNPKQPELPMGPGTGKPNGNGVSAEGAALIHKAFDEAPPGPNEKPAAKVADANDFKSGMERKIKEHTAKRGASPARRPGRGH